MIGVLGLTLWGTALAQDVCPERLDAAGFKARVEAVREPVAFADPEAQRLIREIEALVPDCLAGPVETEDLAALWLARGAFEILRPGGDLEKADTRLTWAYVVGSSWAYDDIYGPQVLDRFETIASQLLPKGTLDLSFPEGVRPSAIYLNGDLMNRTGPILMSAGMHLVQWQVGDQWTAQLVPLRENSRLTVGGGLPTEAAMQQKQSGAFVAYDKKKDRNRGLSLTGLAGYGGTRNWVNDGTMGYVGLALAPVFRAEVSVLALDFLRVRVVGGWTPGVMTDQAPLFTRAGLLVGLHLGTPSASMDAQLGVAAAVLPVVVPAGSDAPEFEATRGLGPQARFDVSTGPVMVNLVGTWYLDAFGVDLGVNSELRSLARAGILPLVGVNVAWLNTPAASNARDNYLAVMLELGGQWSL